MLYIVATPIGNLADITLRAIEILRGVDIIVSEDSRKTSILLNHYEIKKPQIANNNFNEKTALPKIIKKLEEGNNVALVSSAGTPGISDPGYLLIRAAIDLGIEVTSAPGPSAMISALILSGLPMHSFTFRGFSPYKEGPRQKFLKVDENSPHTLIYYESPYRIKAFLNSALKVFGARQAFIANDLTKKFETFFRGTLSELSAIVNETEVKGEYVIIIEGK